MTVASLTTERDWQRTLTDAAELFRWSWVHFRPAQTLKGWRTPVSGPLGAGFVDLVLVRDRVLFVELKSEHGRLSDEQRAVHDSLRRAGCEVYVWRPSDLAAVLEALR